MMKIIHLQKNFYGRGLLEVSQSKLLFKTGLTPKLDQVAQSFVQMISEYLQGKRFDKLSEKSVPVLKDPQEEVFFVMSN